MKNNEPTRIGTIKNYYGGLFIKNDNNKFYWSILDYDGHKWEEITLELYKTLMKLKNKND